MIEKIIKSNLSDEEKISLINEKINELENKILAHGMKLSAIIKMIKEPVGNYKDDKRTYSGQGGGG